MTYYYRQRDRQTGDVVGYVSYDNIKPSNDNAVIVLEEIAEEEYISIFSFEYVTEEDE